MRSTGFSAAMRSTGALIAVLALAAFAVLLPRASHHAQRAGVRPGTASVPLATEPAPSRPDVGFQSHERLVEHYKKHGRDFGRISMNRYLRLAQALRDRPAGGLLLEAVRPDGVITRYDRASGAFIAFDRDGTIRTFFRPARGDAYFRSQLRRSH